MRAGILGVVPDAKCERLVLHGAAHAPDVSESGAHSVDTRSRETRNFGGGAEAPFSQMPSDVFILRWLSIGMDAELDSPMMAAECEILYHTMGTQAFGGLDRGRSLSEMDKELLKILTPLKTPKLSYAVNPPSAMLTQVFWDEPTMGPAAIQRDRVSRSVKVKVYCYLEEGE